MVETIPAGIVTNDRGLRARQDELAVWTLR
jgi:hypothetical protein